MHDSVSPTAEGYTIQFDDVPVIEFIRFVSKISEENFIYDHKDMDFNVSLSTGKAIGPAKVVQALVQLLKVHGFNVSRQAGYYVIRKLFEDKESGGLLASNDLKMLPGIYSDSEGYEFFSYKVQYHEGAELEESLKKIAADLRNQADAPLKLINATQTPTGMDQSKAISNERYTSNASEKSVLDRRGSKLRPSNPEVFFRSKIQFFRHVRHKVFQFSNHKITARHKQYMKDRNF